MAALQALYLSIIHCQILYGITAWGTAIHNTNNNTTFKLKKKAIRIISKIPHRAHIDLPFKTKQKLKY